MQEYELLKEKSLADLREIAKTFGLTKISSLRKNDLLLRLKEHFEAEGIEQKPVQKQPVRKAASRPAAKPAEKTKTENEEETPAAKPAQKVRTRPDNVTRSRGI